MVDQNKQALLRNSIEQFYFAYRAFTERPDKILEQRGLGRVHHRILYFVAHRPGLSVNELLTILDVSKQALNAPLRQLLEMKLLSNDAADHDRRVKQIYLTDDGRKLEAQLTSTQMKQLDAVFQQAGSKSAASWLSIMKAIAAEP
jgi:DNA-binding MarR family transcriptional regulator